MKASEQHTRNAALGRPGLLLGPLGPMAPGRAGESAPAELASGVQAMVAQLLCRGDQLACVSEAVDCLRLLWDVRVAHLWLPVPGGWRSLPTHRGAVPELASPNVAEALSVAATSAQRLDWPSAPHQLDSAPGEALASATFQPVVHQDHLHGVLSLHFVPSRGFPTADGALLVALVRQLGSALALADASTEGRAAMQALVHEAQQHASMRLAAEEAKAALQAKVARLKREDQVKTDFLANLSHELRSPLTTIIGYGSMLEDEVVGPLAPEQGLMVRRMLTAADAITWLVEDLLDLSRLRAGNFRLEPRSSQLADLLMELAAALGPMVDRAQVRLNLEVPQALPPIVVDPRRIGQALRNLLTNAIKHAPKGSVVTVRLVGTALGQRLEVQDQGPGVPLADQQAIFEPYRQLGPAGQGEGGLGLGLAITKRLVQAHGGQVGLCPKQSDGACFYIELPLRPPEATDQA